jgi:hypothetical protein
MLFKSDSDEIQTRNLFIRSELLYSVELQNLIFYLKITSPHPLHMTHPLSYIITVSPQSHTIIFIFHIIIFKLNLNIWFNWLVLVIY